MEGLRQRDWRRAVGAGMWGGVGGREEGQGRKE